MRKWQKLTLATSVAVAAACALAGSAASRQGLRDASVIELLGRPDEYDGTPVRVTGFLHCKFEDSSIFVAKEHADYLMNGYGLWVSIEPDAVRFQPKERKTLYDFDGKYVLLEGTFKKGRSGHLGAFNGEIREVHRVMELTRYYDGAEEVSRR